MMNRMMKRDRQWEIIYKFIYNEYIYDQKC